MSEEVERAIEDKLDSVSKLLPLIRIMLVCAFAIGGWVIKLTLDVESTKLTAHKNGDAVSEFKLWTARTDASRYTASEAAKLQQGFIESMNAHALRVQRLEDSQLVITKALERIEKAVGTDK